MVSPPSNGSTQDAFRRGEGRRWIAGLALSAAVHLVLLFGLPVIPTSQTRAPPRPELEVVALPAGVTRAPPRVEVPEPVVPVPRPPPPTAETRNEEPPVPPPRLTPHDVPPRLLNREEVEQTLLDLYPGTLELMELGGVVTLWLYIDTDGTVLRTVVREPSRFELFNRAAEAVARTMRFRPARQAGNPVAVWVQQAIRFRTVEATPTASRGETTGPGSS